MANPFAKNTPKVQNGFGNSFYGYNSQPTPANSIDPADYAAEMILRSGGDAKAAFYLACKEKGVNAEDFLKNVQAIQNPKAAIQSAIANNPKAKTLFTLFSSMK